MKCGICGYDLTEEGVCNHCVRRVESPSHKFIIEYEYKDFKISEMLEIIPRKCKLKERCKRRKA